MKMNGIGAADATKCGGAGMSGIGGGGPICPYCEKEQDYPDSWPDSESERVHVECSCGKSFAYSVSWSPDYMTFEAPCLNDGEHKLGDCYTYGYPGGPHKYKECMECGEVFYPPSHPMSKEAHALRAQLAATPAGIARACGLENEVEDAQAAVAPC